ncbi:MaoC family dehydratase N-terminal domain-containing protein [Fictibacillus nanhaiensis]|uniref:MaoC family dehydratase n=1 Tax=Fictibacillus nanhaiensis TaxID=742169 RepID=UPI001C96F7CB|nr:MaoC/PaaZ C-terminal domain-containing protein [Fictibacillus nanhaiensis]MBY6035217.1 MaoC family dehydratase N-terminal domain-containing protein [Fictibacillus nanhaiensis]
MLIGKKRKLGRKINEIQIGEKLEMQETIEDKDLLLYLGLTNDNNPLFIQHDYASLTPFKKPVVPQIMLMGMVTSAVSKYLPGPGSSITHSQFTFHKPVYHYSKLTFYFEITEVNRDNHSIGMTVLANNEEGTEVLHANLNVCPPYPPKPITSHTMENF